VWIMYQNEVLLQLAIDGNYVAVASCDILCLLALSGTDTFWEIFTRGEIERVPIFVSTSYPKQGYCCTLEAYNV
jgi:hypothetical protein